MRSIQISIAVVLSMIFLASCGSDKTTTARPTLNPSPGGTGANSGQPVDSKTGTIFAGNSVSFQLDFANPYQTQCVDGSTPISWKLIGDSSQMTLTDTDKCHPTLTTTASYTGGGQVVGDLTLTDPGLVRYTATLALKTPSFFHFSSPLVASNMWWKNVPTSISEATAKSWYYTANETMLLNNNSSNRACAGHPYFYNAPTSIRQFQVQLPPGAIADLDNEPGLQVTGTCSTPAYNGVQYFLSCPFTFGPIDPATGLVTFQVNGAVGTAPSCNSTYFFAADEFRANPPIYDTYVFPINIQLSATHPHLAAPVTTTIGVFKLAFTYQ